MDQDIVDYITQAQKHGLSDFEIKQNLLSEGWEGPIIEQSFVFARASENKSNFADSANMHSPKASPMPLAHSQNPAPEAVGPALSALPSPGHLSDTQFPKVAGAGKSFFKKPALWIAVAALLVLAGGAYGYYNYVYMTPARVWDNFLSSKKSPIFKTNYTISYSDKSAAASTSTTGSLSLAFSSSAAQDASDSNNIKASGSANVSAGAVGVSYNMPFKYVLLGQVVYLDLSQIDLLKSYLGSQNIQWLKLDLNELKKFTEQAASSSNESINQDQLKAALQPIWANKQIIKPTNFLAKEAVNGIAVYHIKNQFDMQAFATAFLDSIDAIENAQKTGAAKLTTEQRQALSIFINKFQVKDFDLYIGQKDYQLYSINLSISAPSVADFSNPDLADLAGPLSSARAKSRDAKRLGDVQQMRSGLELYFNDFGGYPNADATGSPLSMAPYYISSMPIAPEPSDGACTDYYNGYWYAPEGTPKTVKGQKVYPSYSLTFCLGNNTGGYKAGIAKLTPAGIADNIPCPSTPDECVGSNQTSAADYSKAIGQMNFNAEIKFTADYSDYGQPQNIAAPDNSTDIMDLIKGFLPGGMPTTSPATSTPSGI